MRFLLLAFLSVLVSCGQSGSSKSGSGSDEPQNQEYITDVREVDLLDVAMDVPVEITGNRIIFKETMADSANGLRSTCNMGVTTGEAYIYVVSGAAMTIKTRAGQRMSFKRVSGSGNSILGSWSGKTYEGNKLVMRRMTFVSSDRLIMRTHCES
jgi:hypothetical protein